ncbi:MAG: hypothetical protein CMO01_31930 [Thalassobius sp.]|nr:hypothetical protein [Thalassovita sp.]|tara:strand:+ start:17 stop:358 length:342 start_codon:yes stop_codon:yes gene_type:complete
MAKERPEDKLLKFQKQQRTKSTPSTNAGGSVGYTPKSYMRKQERPPSEKGTKEGYTRYTVIANKEQIRVAKAIAWFERKEIKHVIEEALDEYFQHFNLNKILKEYEGQDKRNL